MGNDMAATAANKNRKVRQDALREQLSNQKLVEKVIDIARKFDEQGASMESSEIQALRASADIRLKLINKYLPDLKATELTGADGGALEFDGKWVVEFVEAIHAKDEG